MPTINLSQFLEYDFEGYVQGNTFVFYLDFYQDDAETVPRNISTSSFIFDLLRKDGGCCWANNQVERLILGDGLSIADDDRGNVNNRLVISKILQSTPGHYNQNLTETDPASKVTTWEKGNLKIDKKV